MRTRSLGRLLPTLKLWQAGRAPSLILAAALTLGAALSFSGRAWAGEAATTHRASDPGSYSASCGDAEPMIAVAERGGALELWEVMVEQGKCSESPTRIEGQLEAWIAGPFMPRNTRVTGSVWRVRNQYGDTVFVWIGDGGGRHAARREMAL